MWTLRVCRVNATGTTSTFPDVVLAQLTAPERLNAVPSLARERNIVVSSCESTKGDSGGPLVDVDGRIVGLTYASPTDQSAAFTYHIALDEIRKFMANVSREPILVVPDAWTTPPAWGMVDRRVLAAGEPNLNHFFLDLDGDTPASLIDEENYADLVGRQEFDAEFVAHYLPGQRLAFYDSDNDGTIDEIAVFRERLDSAALRFRLVDGQWRSDPNVELGWADASVFDDERLRAQFTELVDQVLAP